MGFFASIIPYTDFDSAVFGMLPDKRGSIINNLIHIEYALTVVGFLTESYQVLNNVSAAICFIVDDLEVVLKICKKFTLLEIGDGLQAFEQPF